MKYEYGVIVLIKANGKLNITVINVVAENESDAEYFALKTAEAQGFEAMRAPDLAGTKVVQNNGVASAESVKAFEKYCDRIGVKLN